MATPWNWKNKDGASGGLLYASGNWGDVLKMMWLLAIIAWKKENVTESVNYFDPFAGDVHYPVSEKTLRRIKRCDSARLAPLGNAFVDNGLWPSAASGARAVAGGSIDVWDADPGRRDNWRNTPGVTVATEGDGWRLLRERAPDPRAVWLLDPYDFLAEWREHLPLVAETSRTTSILLYLYNRSAKSDAAFRDYRACKTALEERRGDLPKRVGRAAADVFLPRSHHELWFLPSGDDANAPGFESLLGDLAASAASLDEIIRRSGVCDD